MGSNHIKDFNLKFMEKGLFPLEEIKDGNQKIVCVDKEGYKYFLSYHASVGDKRTEYFDRWSKNNPFKAYNMRLYASTFNVEILSSDDELFNSTCTKVKFKCPKCGKHYHKKWCHWLEQPKERKNCQECNKKQSQYSLLTELWLKENNIDYTKEFRFKNCRDKYPLPFDFKIDWKGKIILIEVDGAQHYYASFGDDGTKLKDQKRKDTIKDNYCKANNFILLRIPWTYYKKDKYTKELEKIFFP